MDVKSKLFAAHLNWRLFAETVFNDEYPMDAAMTITDAMTITVCLFATDHGIMQV
jgi:hypothetical protein